MRPARPSITPALFAFLRDLASHNDRDWFAANQQRYEAHLLAPLLAFIEDFAAPLREISPHFRAEARKVGGSLFRLHRDVRFSADKSPYKTNAGVHFRHANARDAHAPGFYLHLAPGEVFVAAGLWRPAPAVARQVREAILQEPEGWLEAVGEPALAAAGLRLAGDSYRRPPTDVPADHPLGADLLRKDFLALADLSEEEVCGDGFLLDFVHRCRAAVPLMRFLTQAVGQPF